MATTSKNHKDTYKGTVQSALKACRKRLKAAGWPMGKIGGGKQRTIEGINVHRLGCSETIYVSWHGPQGAAVWRAKQAEARDLLRAAGFPFDDQGRMRCAYGI